jgi:ABC-2 type transport system ATP-binding protein
MIEVSNLYYEYPGIRALKNVTFSVESGSTTALVGPNGAGKTTLMRCIAGMDHPLSGEISVNGVDVVAEPRRSHQSIGYLSDLFGLYDRLTIHQSLSYVAAANGIAKRKISKSVQWVANELDLYNRLEQPIRELSRGLRQRVAIAQILIHTPQVIVLDEPASGLDPEARYELGELFLKLRQRGHTLLISSHILSELESYSTHMLILQEGEVIRHQALNNQFEAISVLEIQVLGSKNVLCDRLETDDRISDLETIECGFRFCFSGDVIERVGLLESLVEAGIKVSNFTVQTMDLQKSYLGAMARGGGDEP